MHRVRGAMTPPLSAASRAFRTTSLASSAQQSEYSNPSVYWGLSGSPAGSSVNRRVRVGGNSRARQDGRREKGRFEAITRVLDSWWGSTKRSGQTIWGAIRHKTSRSRAPCEPNETRNAPNSAGRHGSACSRRWTSRTQDRPSRKDRPTSRVRRRLWRSAAVDPAADDGDVEVAPGRRDSTILPRPKHAKASSPFRRNARFSVAETL